ECAETQFGLCRQRSLECNHPLQHSSIEFRQDNVHRQIGRPEATRALRPSRAPGGRNHRLQQRHVGSIKGCRLVGRCSGRENGRGGGGGGGKGGQRPGGGV